MGKVWSGWGRGRYGVDGGGESMECLGEGRYGVDGCAEIILMPLGYNLTLLFH